MSTMSTLSLFFEDMYYFRISVTRIQTILLAFFLSIFVFFRIISSDCGRNNDEPLDWPKHEKRFVSVEQNAARLANNIFELCSLYGISKYLDRQPIFYIKDERYVKIVENMNFIMPELMKKFELRTVQNLANVPKIEFNKKCCVFDDPAKLKSREEEHIHLTGTFYQSYKYFDLIRDEIRSFVLQERVKSQLPVSDSNNFILCIHSRRTDFVDGQHHSSDREFIRSARDFIRERENQANLITVLMGDDYSYELNVFGNETNVFVSSDSPHNDLIYSRSNCDAALITAPSSTFGWWIAYLSKGERVYYLDIKTTTDVNYMVGQLNPEDFFDSRWTSLKFNQISKEVSLSL